jgi:hypothetical protein
LISARWEIPKTKPPIGSSCENCGFRAIAAEFDHRPNDRLIGAGMHDDAFNRTGRLLCDQG